MAEHNTTFDDVIIGSGVGGLFTGALLASAGRRVCVLERHYAFGGYGHTFVRPGYTFCSDLHYLFNCLPGEDGEVVFDALGLHDEVSFAPLDAGGFDRLHFSGLQYDYVLGPQNNRDRLSERFPEHAAGLARYFGLLEQITDELYEAPLGFSFLDGALHPLRFRHLVRYRHWTVQRLFDELAFPVSLQAILAGQSLDIAEPPERASLLMHAGNSTSYMRGACVPTHGFEHLFRSVVDSIQRRAGCEVRKNARVTSLSVGADDVRAAVLADGTEVRAERFVYAGDPKAMRALLPEVALPASFEKKLQYEYSPSSITLHLGLRGIDLAAHGFGNWNVWSYGGTDLNECYRRQLVESRMDDPMLFIGTPTLHHTDVSIAPAGHHQMIVVTLCSYDHFRRLKDQNDGSYEEEKSRIVDAILDKIEREFIPDLRSHIDHLETGTPTTNERYVATPRGNAYGQALTPENIHFGKLDYRSPWPNLFLVGATAGIPSFGGGLHCALLLFEKLAGVKLKRGTRDATRI